MNIKDMTDEQKTRARECNSPEELMALAEEEGIELTDEQLNKVSGGWFGDDDMCSQETGYYG